MALLHLMVWFLGAIGTAALSYLVVGKAITIILTEALPDKVARAFDRITIAGMFLVATLAGVGFLSKGYPGYAKSPETEFDWFATFYNAAAYSGTAILSFLGIFCFTCLVLHVGLVRAKITAGTK
jgi:hypothetical protein